VKLFAERGPGGPQPTLNCRAMMFWPARAGNWTACPCPSQLVAAQLSAFPVDDIERFLAEWFAFPWAGPRVGTYRHSSVESSLEWSYRLLTDQEQQALRMLSVFRSPFRLDGAKAVITSACPEDEVMPLVASMVPVTTVGGC
jgi:predicted ATPase